jgi:hypothetical protein
MIPKDRGRGVPHYQVVNGAGIGTGAGSSRCIRTGVCRLRSGAPGAQFYVEGGNGWGFVVRSGGVLVDGGRGLGAEVAVPDVKIKRADAVFTVRAGELDAVLDALGTVGFH